MSKKEFILQNTKAIVADKGVVAKHDAVIPGFYKIKLGMFDSSAHSLEVMLPNASELTAKLILDTDEITELFSEESLKVHASLNIKAKLGYILEGVHGTGKTTAALAAGKYCIDNLDACVFVVKDIDEVEGAFEAIKQFRQVSPDMTAVVFLDECEVAMERNESDMKRLLDGAETPTKLIFIGATNYIDQIPEAIKGRPSRIKHVFACSDLLNEEEIVWSILSNMNNAVDAAYQLTDEELKKITPLSVSKTIDEIKHLYTDTVLTKTRLKIRRGNPSKTQKLISDGSTVIEEMT